MKGKKTDSEFISEFILESINCGINTPEEIVIRAKNIINNIDNEIIHVEKQKIIRSKLLDVLSNLDKTKKNRQNEIKILSFLQLNNDIYKYICQELIKSNIKQLSNLKYPISDILFAIKQLIEHKIIYKQNDFILQGSMFNEYLDFIKEIV